MQFIDISNDLLSAEVYPEDPVPELAPIQSLQEGDNFTVNALYASLHNGTHMDAPLHVFSDGADIANVPLELCIGPCYVLSVPEGLITGEFMENHFPEGAKRLLLKSAGKAFLHDSAVEVLLQYGCHLLGTDALSVEAETGTGSVHRALLNRGCVLLEGLNLAEVKDGNYFLFAPPIKIESGEAGFVRAVLVKDYIFWSGQQHE